MRSKLQFTLVLIYGLLVGGCASGPSSQQLQSADYGAPVSQAEAEALAAGWLSTRLKDPMSAVTQWAPVTQGWVPNAPVYGIKLTFGYVLTGSVNARNSYGGYVGAKQYQFLIRDGRIANVSAEECLSGGGCYLAPVR